LEVGDISYTYGPFPFFTLLLEFPVQSKWCTAFQQWSRRLWNGV